jgi:hypothetical protein
MFVLVFMGMFLLGKLLNEIFVSQQRDFCCVRCLDILILAMDVANFCGVHSQGGGCFLAYIGFSGGLL